MSGSETNGAWPVTDWVPILVKSSVSLGCLPDKDEVSTTCRLFLSSAKASLSAMG
jgi:thioester reductase-like protein